MKNLTTELTRLYLVPDGGQPGEGGMLNRDGSVKAMVLELSGPADWRVLSSVWQGVQRDLGLPAPAIAVSGTDGLQLWFSMDAPVSSAQAIQFLNMLKAKYLGDITSNRIKHFPFEGVPGGAFVHAPRVPEQRPSNGNWSAFISSDLASIFGNEPWLDVQPNQEAQAEILMRITPIKLAQFQKLVEQHTDLVQVAVVQDPSPQASPADEMKFYCVKDLGSNINLGGIDPKVFLENVMRNPDVPLLIRVEAAKALLPSITAT
jgi:hypothetical protein